MLKNMNSDNTSPVARLVIVYLFVLFIFRQSVVRWQRMPHQGQKTASGQGGGQSLPPDQEAEDKQNRETACYLYCGPLRQMAYEAAT